MTISQILALNAAVILGMMLALWAISLRLKDASIVDIFWGLGFVLVSWVTFPFGSGSSRAIILVLLTTLWGFRLAAYLSWRNHGRGEDPRYKSMRDHHGKGFWWISLFTVFILQGAVMWLISLPVQVGQFDNKTFNDSSMSLWHYAGIGVWLVGFLFESIGDFQLARYKQKADPSRKVMDRGLWRYTRHPNYFGNALVWWGLFLVAVSGSTVWLVISPLLMTFLLVKVSGVALLERDLAGRSEEYRDYIRRTSPFIPWPTKSGR